MTLLLRAITSTPTDTAPVEGVEHIEMGGLTIWATSVPSARGPFSRDDLQTHHHLMCEICDRVEACLPARFPEFFVDADALAAQLEVQYTALTRQLDSVLGCCELAVTALWTEPEAAAPSAESGSPGRRYLLQRQLEMRASEKRQDQARQLADELERLVKPDLVRAERQVCPSAAVALSLALLVRRGKAVDVTARLSRVYDGVRILLNGPWPPYSFAAVRSDELYG